MKKLITASSFLLCVLFVSLSAHAQCPSQEMREDGEKWYYDIDTECFSEFLRIHKRDPKVVLLDVRTKEEFDAERLEGATLLDYYGDDFFDQVKDLEPTNIYLIYCRTGNRSGRTLGLMRYFGFEEVYSMEGGIVKWREEGRPTIIDEDAPEPQAPGHDGYVVSVNDDTFQREVLDEKGAVLVKFFSPTCPPCKALKPIYEDLAKIYHDKLKFAEVDVTKYIKTFRKFGLKYTPTVMLFKDGEDLETQVGLRDKFSYIKMLKDHDIIE